MVAYQYCKNCVCGKKKVKQTKNSQPHKQEKQTNKKQTIGKGLKVTKKVEVLRFFGHTG